MTPWLSSFLKEFSYSIDFGFITCSGASTVHKIIRIWITSDSDKRSILTIDKSIQSKRETIKENEMRHLAHDHAHAYLNFECELDFGPFDWMILNNRITFVIYARYQ